MIKFEKVKRFKDIDIPMPERKTAAAAGYDFVVAEDITIPPYQTHFNTLSSLNDNSKTYLTLADVADKTKLNKNKPSLVSTGMKCYLDKDCYLELSVRSSCPLKHWLVLANGVGIIDADYADNSDNEGEIFFQLINLSPYNILLRKGDIIGQGIIKKYLTTDDDNASGVRTGGFGSTTKEKK